MIKFLLPCLLFLNMSLNAQISLGTGSTNRGTAPVSTYYGYSYVQQIFTKQEINANAAGNITGLKFYLNPSMSISNSSQWVVYLGITDKTNFTSNNDWVPSTQLTEVFSGTVTNSNGIVQVTFPTPFAYSNVGNLVVAAEENMAGYDSNDYDEAMYVYTGAPNSSIYYKSDYTNPDPASPPTDGNLVNYKSVVTFDGLSPSATAACPFVTYPSNNGIFVPLTPTITWNNSSGATGYKVSVGTTPGSTDIVNQAPVSTNSYTLSTSLSSGGTYYLKVTAVGTGGESSGCSEIMFTTMPPPPNNDECADAITLTVNPDLNCGTVTAGYTLGASDSGTPPDPCYGNADDDVWFKFVATATAHKITLSNIVSVGEYNDTDTYFQVFSGDCGSLSSILCSDPDTATLSGLMAGETYYVRVYSYYGAGSNQSFNICVGTFPPPPANDECSGALQATSFPYTYAQNDAAGATNNSGFITACSSAMNDGTWFTFTGDGGDYNISVAMPSGSEFDPKIGVFSGDCNSLSCEGVMDDGGWGATEALTVSSVAGTTYYVNVGYYSGSNDEPEGPFTITISRNNLSIAEVSSDKKSLKLYPTPFTDIINISESEKVKSVLISDASGRTVRVIDNPGSAINAAELKQGMYMVTLHLKDGSKQTIKTIKK